MVGIENEGRCDLFQIFHNNEICFSKLLTQKLNQGYT